MERPFEMRSSIIRRTIRFACFLPFIFVADFFSTYVSNHFLVEELQRIHRANQSASIASNVSASIEAALDAFRQYSEHQEGAKRVAFAENLRNAQAFVEDLVERHSESTEEGKFARSVKHGLRSIAQAADDSGTSAVLIVSQFALENEENLRKLRLALRQTSDQAFESIYSRRWLPFAVTAVLDAIFLVMLSVLLVPLLRSLVRSVKNLTDASDRITKTDPTYQAPVLTEDELGKVTEAFNRVVQSLNLKEQEGKARAEAERQRLEFISRTAEELARSLDQDKTLQNLAQAAVPYLADWCVVDLFTKEGGVRRAAGAHADPRKTEAMKKLIEAGPKRVEQSRFLSEVRKTRQSVLLPVVSSDSYSDGDWPGKEIVRKLGVESALCVPILARQEVVGAVSLVSTRPERKYERKDRIVAEDLARRAGYSIENARLFAEVKEAVEVRDDFLSIASHELRTPLTPLKMQIQLLSKSLTEQQGISPDRVEKFVNTADRMVTRLTRLVQDLLEVSRINSGRIELQYEEVDVVPMFREVLDRFRLEIEKSGSAIDFRAPPKAVGSWDPGKIEQVFVNLLTNALKYGDGKPIEIEVAWNSKDELRLRVRDHGIGIAPEDQKRIFERFERAVKSSHYGGLGLGLYITAQIVQLHGGHIHLDSNLGKGAEFIVLLPTQPEISH